jgi:F0F1-type ATP synthase membrane subunit b/b'
MKKNAVLPALAALIVLFGCVAHVAAAPPVENINPGRHPHLATAQRLSREAFEQISAAQAANNYDMEGHAAKAKQLLEQLNFELKLAAEAANRNAPR